MFVISLLSTCISLALLSTTPSNAATLVRRSTGTFTGQGTYYGANRGQAGNCALDEPILDPQSVDVVAINFGQYDGGAVCGTCVEVTGAAGTVVARVTDKCPSCAQGDLDLSEEMFPKIDDPGKLPVFVFNLNICLFAISYFVFLVFAISGQAAI
jgi:expansin (peptidoglycan-binding protein)